MAASLGPEWFYDLTTGFTAVGRSFLKSYSLHTPYPDDIQLKELEEKTGCGKKNYE